MKNQNHITDTLDWMLYLTVRIFGYALLIISIVISGIYWAGMYVARRARGERKGR